MREIRLTDKKCLRIIQDSVYWRAQRRQTSLSVGKLREGSLELVTLMWERGRREERAVRGWGGGMEKGTTGAERGQVGGRAALHQWPQSPVITTSAF